ncbi:hypothetical protein BJX70DRAFT_108085 [Aspergillus crustosus]
MSDTDTRSSVSGVLLVGSVPLASTEEVFTKLSTSLAGRITAIPDGETGARYNYIVWEKQRFPREVLRHAIGGIDPPPGHSGQFALDDVKPTEYGTAAVESYQVFLQHREKNIIPAGVRFQVCLPLPFAPIQGQIRPEFQAQIEPLYEQRMADALREILENIPPSDLVIQLDICLEILALEAEKGRLSDFFLPHFSRTVGIESGLLDRIARFIELIPRDVPLAFHFCYGDRDHKHFVEPEDLALVVDFANRIRERIQRPVTWMHFPVPKNRNDVAYFEPLRRLELGNAAAAAAAAGTDAGAAETKLYLGLVHANDEDGTRERVQAALSVVKRFGVATECGLGRTPVAELDSIFSISRDVTVL